MKTLLLTLTLLLASIFLHAQPNSGLSLSGPSTAKPGDTVAVSINHNLTGAVGFQWTLGTPQGWVPTITLAQPVAVTKTLACTIDNKLCLVYGLNTTVIPSGAVATVSIPIPANQPAGQAALSLSGVLSVSATNASLPVTVSGLSINILVPILEDLNGDSKVDLLDIQIAVDQVRGTGGSTCGSADLNKDGKCDLLDVFRVVLKSLGLI